MVGDAWVAPCHGNLPRGHDGAAVTPSSPDQVAAAMGPAESFCLRSTKARLLIRDGDGGEGEQKVKARLRVPTRKTEDAVDRRQNNKDVKAVSLRHCAATSVLCICSQLLCRTVTKTMSVAPLLRNN